MDLTESLILQSPFNRAGEYLLYLNQLVNSKFIKNISENNWYNSENIDERLNSSRYFVLPNETNFTSRFNCFEQNAAYYLALKKIYPKSNPSLVNLLLDDANMHSGVLFTHEDRLHYADPVRKIFGPCELEMNGVKILKNLVSNSLFEGEIKFNEIFQVSTSSLEEIISHLRKPEGIISFFYGSGQIASFIPEWPYHKELFIHVDDAYMIHGQIRIEDTYPTKDNVMIMIKYNPFSNEYSFHNFIYSDSFWQTTNDKKILRDETENKGSVAFKQKFIAKKVSDYLAKTQMSFISNNDDVDLKYEALEKLESVPKDFDAAARVNLDFFASYIDFVWQDEKEDFGKVYDFGDSLESILLPKKSIQVNKAVERIEKEIWSRYRFQLFRLAWDFKRYANEIKNYI